MSGKNNTHEAAVLNVMRATTLTSFGAFIALYTAAPTDTTNGTEVTGGGYARASVTFGAPTGAGPSSMTNTNDIIINMPAATVIAAALCDASSGAATIRYWAATTSTVFAAGDQAHLAVGSITVTED